MRRLLRVFAPAARRGSVLRFTLAILSSSFSLIDAAGLPLGVQIVGRFGRDRATLEAAAFVENVLARRR